MGRRTSIFCVLIILAECAVAVTRQCNHCKENVLNSDKFCPYCGQILIVQPKPTPPQARPQIPASPPYRSIHQTQPSYYSRDEYHHHESDAGEFSLVDRLGGMGRGIITAVLSPLNVIRGALVGASWACESAGLKRRSDGTYYAPNNSDVDAALGAYMLNHVTCPVGTVVGAFTTCADAVNGVVDLISAGYYGDWLYDSNLKGHPTPWVWEREWKTTNIPWINR